MTRKQVHSIQGLRIFLQIAVIALFASTASAKDIPTVVDEHGPAIKQPVVKTAPIKETKHAEHAAEEKEAQKSETKATKTAAAVEKSHNAESDTGVAATQSLQWLKNGNTRYVKRNYRKDGKSSDDRKRLTGGQKPHAIVLSCSDSRVPPEIVFDQALGEIFVIRVAGEALDSSVIASIEYAVEHLGSHLLVVMGHSQCGAVKAAIGAKEGESVGTADLDKLVADIRPRLKTVLKDKPSPNLEVESAVNADGVTRDLVRRSELIRKKVESGSLTIKSALYRLDTGNVSFY